jgi:hypothetical protein
MRLCFIVVVCHNFGDIVVIGGAVVIVEQPLVGRARVAD